MISCLEIVLILVLLTLVFSMWAPPVIKKPLLKALTNKMFAIFLVVLVVIYLWWGPHAIVAKRLEMFIEKSPKGTDNDPCGNSKMPFTFYYFYMTNCPHCVDFTPIWEDISKTLSTSDKVCLAKVESKQNKLLLEKHGVSGFPTLVLVNNKTGKGTTFEGRRDHDAIISFVKSHSNS